MLKFSVNKIAILEDFRQAFNVEEIEKQLKDFDGCWNDIATQVIEGKEKVGVTIRKCQNCFLAG